MIRWQHALEVPVADAMKTTVKLVSGLALAVLQQFVSVGVKFHGPELDFRNGSKLPSTAVCNAACR